MDAMMVECVAQVAGALVSSIAVAGDDEVAALRRDHGRIVEFFSRHVKPAKVGGGGGVGPMPVGGSHEMLAFPRGAWILTPTHLATTVCVMQPSDRTHTHTCAHTLSCHVRTPTPNPNPDNPQTPSPSQAMRECQVLAELAEFVGADSLDGFVLAYGSMVSLAPKLTPALLSGLLNARVAGAADFSRADAKEARGARWILGGGN